MFDGSFVALPVREGAVGGAPYPAGQTSDPSAIHIPDI
jgi:hypothetical protein